MTINCSVGDFVVSKIFGVKAVKNKMVCGFRIPTRKPFIRSDSLLIFKGVELTKVENIFTFDLNWLIPR